jgi:hypothetical protein
MSISRKKCNDKYSNKDGWALNFDNNTTVHADHMVFACRG